MRAFKQKRASLKLLRNSRSNSAPKWVPSKCSRNQISISPYIHTENKTLPKKSCLKWSKANSEPFQTSKRSISKNFPINKCWQEPSQGPLTPPLAPKLIKIGMDSDNLPSWTEQLRSQNQLKPLPSIKTTKTRLFPNQKNPSGTLPKGFDPVSRRLLLGYLNFGQICKRTRTAAASTSSSFLRHLECLMVLFLGARMIRLGF